MYNKVVSFIEENQLINIHEKVVVGVSGGVDSMVLLEILNNYIGNENIVVAHVNHGFRDESMEEYLFVEKYCNNLNIDFYGIFIDVPAYKIKNNLSTQIAARECRYGFYSDLMNVLKINQLVLGHHGDDLIESILMRQVSGSSNKGLIGIPMKRDFNNGSIVRPFLCINKESIYEYAKFNNTPFREDQSNLSDNYVRNRIRHHVLPKLKEENHLVHERFLSQSIERSEDEDYFELEISNLISKDIIKNSNGFVLVKNDFNNYHISLKKRLLKRLLNDLGIFNIDDNIICKLEEKIKNPNSSDFIELVKGIVVLNDYDKFHLYDSSIVDFNEQIKNCYLVTRERDLELLDLDLNLKADGLYKGNNLLVKGNLESCYKLRYSLPGDRILVGNSSKKLNVFLSQNKYAIGFRKRMILIELDGVLVNGFYGDNILI